MAATSESQPSKLKITAGYIKKILLISLLLLPLLVVLIVDYFRIPETISESERISLIIKRGSSMDAIADSLYAKKLISDKDLFILWLTTLDKDRQLKAGYYEIPKGLTYAQLISFLSQSTSKEIKVTLIEGWRLEDIAEELHKRLQINKNIFISLARDTSFISELGVQAQTLEGYLLPDTYLFYWGVDAESVIRYLVDRCFAIFTEEAQTQIESLKLNIHQTLTLASIIEGEAIFDDERETISSVYHNRLRRRIKLQADPTIQYILDGPPRRLLLKDLEIESPYNTYKHYGLPPGPISNPGKRSIHAAIYPVKTNYIYFVAKGDGRHSFSRNAAEHRQAKQEFDKIRREINRNKRASKTKRESQ